MIFKPSKINSKACLIAKLMLVSALLFSIAFFPDKTLAFGSSWNEDFESYDVGFLSDNPKWAGIESTDYYVVDSPVYHGSRAGKADYASDVKYALFYPEQNISSGVKYFSFWVQPTYSNSNYIDFHFYSALEHTFKIQLKAAGSGEFFLKLGGGFFDCDTGEDLGYMSIWTWEAEKKVSTDEWVKFNLKGNFEDDLMEITAETGEFEWGRICMWFGGVPDEALKEIKIGIYKGTFVFDLFEEPEQEARVWGISPESETEITDLSDNFTFGWVGLEDYDGLSISFYNKRTGIHSRAKRYEDIESSGEKTLSLEGFGIDKNADWHFNAIAFEEVPETYSGLYLTGRYVMEYTYDLVSPEYFLIINVEGFPVIFEVEDWSDWYGEHAEKFDAPTPLFERVAVLFTPTFSNIGEFGQQISEYFETDKAYSRGYELGLAIPIFTYYTTSIEMFFGGLPIIKLFLMILLLLVGIFIFKIVLKFIPFFG